MITLEKILFLKSTALFKKVPDDVMETVANAFKEEHYPGDTLILKQGDIGVTLYIIITGKVKVHDNNQTITELGRHEVFGELAALSPEKRIASITSVEDTVVLKIDHDDLYELIAMHVELAKGLIIVLCERVRQIAKQKE